MDTHPKMNPEVKALWIKDLRNNPRKQGRNAMVTDTGKFCCLGRLSKLYADKHGCTLKELYPNSFHTSTLHRDVQRWAGLSARNTTDQLSGRNDGALGHNVHSFAQIADWIDKNL